MAESERRIGGASNDAHPWSPTISSETQAEQSVNISRLSSPVQPHVRPWGTDAIPWDFGRTPSVVESSFPSNSNSPNFGSSIEKTNSPGCDYDVRSLDYVSMVDSNLLCPICHSAFHEPVRLLCDHVFCGDCLRQSFVSRSSTAKTCPSCRTEIETEKVWKLPVPRMVTRMLDELIVKCPNEGCHEEIHRGELAAHVESYCQYSSVPCPAIDCEEKIERIRAEGECLHRIITCQYCGAELMTKDIESHEKHHCNGNIVQCDHCDGPLARCNLRSHSEVCPSAPVCCSGSPYGCPWKDIRTELDQHQSSCVIASLTPFLSSQKDQIANQTAEIALLKRRNEAHENTISAIQSILYSKPTPSSSSTSAPPSTIPLDPESTGNSLDAILSQPSTVPPTDPPFDTPTSHLLYLHENLRSELSRLETALGEVDARCSMTTMNESLRMREDMLQMNSAVSTMRTQLHYLMSAELQRRAAAATVGMQGGLRGNGGAPPGGAPGGPPGASRGTAGGSATGLRRGISEGREGTKL